MYIQPKGNTPDPHYVPNRSFPLYLPKHSANHKTEGLQTTHAANPTKHHHAKEGFPTRR